MSFLSSIHEETPTHPKDDPEVMAKGREVESARVALSDIERRARQLETDRQSADELQALLDTQELASLRQRYIGAKTALVSATRAYDEAVQKARGPWQQKARETYREAALQFLDFLETEALPQNDAMVRAQEAAEQAGLHFDPLHLAHLLPEALAHRLHWRDKLG